MRPLSERLEEIATHYDGDCCDSCDAKIISAIREGAQLAKLYEDAPVLPVVRITATGFTWSAVDVTGYADYGHRVRIVLDKEGV